MRRHGRLALFVLLLPAVAVGDTGEASIATLFERVAAEAEALANAPYDSGSDALPEALKQVDYDTYRQIRFRPDAALWKDDGLFSVQLFHTGFLFESPVQLNVVENGESTPLDFDPDRFRYDDDAAALLEQDLSGAGHAGFRLHFPLNNASYHDEFAVFLGASYFRLVGRDQGYGLSARGLAIDTARPKGEEFPAFREFWLVRPAASATQMTVLALLDSPSITGAYRFHIAPGRNIVVDVEATLFARRKVETLGIAPLTSMFAHGDTTIRAVDDHRPSVHDSDGLLVHTGQSEWIWRPLTNPRSLRVSSLRDDNPEGFGLVQRERDFDRYLDLEARYERRPSMWVQPLEPWSAGGIELVEIPAPDETHDNIVAYWVSDTPLAAGDSLYLRYRTHTFGATLPQQTLGQVSRTRQGWGGVPGEVDPAPRSRRHFMVDFEGGALEGLAPDQPVEASLEASQGDTHHLSVRALPDGKGWRASFRLDPDGQRPSDMRLHLRLHGEPISETWNHVWYPNEQ
ncbi:glucan biosynthesis protein D [Halomonas urumqiensis]|uniref:Glucan biosynthesis protein D n=2 Tax=Halomonas urumqiensis TaxID=1684789 RepID=A0A2N7UDY9_9GAMM|nr:glucan biosynthesis protein D [Halomonas urumqiensis]PTB04313.1 glucan biosynthesis protein D [Halomonas urumqiensis]